MKNSIFTLLLFLVCSSGFSENYKYEYGGRTTPKVNVEKLNQVNLVGEITPDLWLIMQLPYKERQELELRKKTDFSQGYLINPVEYNYSKIVDYVSVEIIATGNGKTISAKSNSEQLTQDQKQILRTADPGTELSIKIDFRFKNQSDNKTNSGELEVTVVPDTEAQYPGGYKQFSNYYTENVFSKVSGRRNIDKILMATVIFTVNADGKISGAKIVRSSTDPNLDNLILEQTNKMPKWNPAKNSQGVNIKQEVRIPFGGEGGC